MWVGHEKHCTRNSQGQRVKGQGHKAIQRSSTKTSNISSKRHSVVEIHLSYRKSKLPERMAGSAVSAHVRWKYAENSLTVLSNRHNFSHFIRIRGRWTRWWGQFLDRKQNWRYFCACTLKKSSKQRKYIPTEEFFTCYRKSASPKRMARSDFDRKLVNRRFCACAVKIGPKLAYYVVKSPKF